MDFYELLGIHSYEKSTAFSNNNLAIYYLRMVEASYVHTAIK
jgi:hypothetical protein